VLLLCLATGSARAQDNLCVDAVVSGQRLFRVGRLHEAQSQFATCAQSTCVSEVVERCVTWLREVDAAMPTIVVAATDSQGRDLDVLQRARLWVDGAEAPDGLSGRSKSLDPGTHRVRLEADGELVEQSIVVRQGEKDRRIELQLPAKKAPPATKPVPVGAFIAGAVGVVALGTFAFFGTRSLVDRGRFGCQAGCAPDQYNQVETDYQVSEVSLVTALASFAVATVFILTRPSQRAGSTLTSTAVSRSLSAGGGLGPTVAFW
jgi:hypothetical protein